MTFIIICGLAITVLLVVSIREDSEEDRFPHAVFLGLLIVSFSSYCFYTGKNLCPDIQYIPAEYVAENETSTYFGTEDGNIFYVDRIPLINRNVPYLLGMDTNGTEDVADDAILTVWALCE